MRPFATLVASAIYGCSVACLAQTASSIVLPIEFDLDPIVADAERELPRQLHSNWEALGKTVKMPVAFRFDAERSPLTVEGRGDRVFITAKILYSVDIGVPGPTQRSLVDWRRINGCRPSKSVTVSLDTRLDLTPEWQLRARSRPTFEMAEPCRLTAARELVNVDISEKVRLAFADGLNKAARDLEKRVAAQMILRDLADRAWQGLAEPVPLGERAWLHLNPARVLIMRPVVNGRTVRTGVIVDGSPVMRSTAEGSAAAPLPALELTDPRDGFGLDWETQLTWPELTAQLRDTLVGADVKVAGRRTVRIEDVDAAFEDGRVLLNAQVSGGVKGRIQLTGQPRLNAATRVLEFADLDFTLETRSFLIRVADWFRHDSTRRKLTTLARVDLNAWLEKSRTRIETGLREKFGSDLRLAGAMELTEPFDLAIDEESVRFTARLRGSLTLRWR